MWLSYNFTAALDFSSLYKPIYFSSHDTTLKKMLKWNKFYFQIKNKQTFENILIINLLQSEQKCKTQKSFNKYE